MAHEGARRVANRGRAHRALQHGGEEGAEELVRDGPQLLFALLRFLCRPGRWSTRLKLQRPPEGSAQVDGNVAKIDLAARGVDGALVHFNAPSWAVQAVMSSNTLPVCPKTGSTSPSLTVHLCLHTALLREIGNAPLHAWKHELQQLADETGLTIEVSHFPPGTSKWNKIEHRLFCHITANWRGTPLTTYETIVDRIGNVRTETGLQVRAELDAGEYPTGVKVTQPFQGAN